MDGRRFAFLEASLVHLGGDEVRVLSLDPFQDSLLHDLGDMRANDYRPDFIEAAGTLGERFL